MTASKINIGRVFLVFGVLGGLVSFWYTLAFSWDPDFGAVNLPDGPTHSNYHAFRGALLALAVNLLLVWVLINASSIQFQSWALVAFMAIFYDLGWWLAWPIWGYHAPYLAAEMNHVLGTIGGLVGLYFLKPQRA